MAETPLFEVIVAEIAAMVGERSPTAAAKTAAVAVHLRQMWNARGAADIAKLETEIPSRLDDARSGGWVHSSLRTLDRS